MVYTNPPMNQYYAPIHGYPPQTNVDAQNMLPPSANMYMPPSNPGMPMMHPPGAQMPVYYQQQVSYGQPAQFQQNQPAQGNIIFWRENYKSKLGWVEFFPTSYCSHGKKAKGRKMAFEINHFSCRIHRSSASTTAGGWSSVDFIRLIFFISVLKFILLVHSC